MVSLGSAALVCALPTAIFAAVAGVDAGRSGDQRMVAAARRAIYACCALLLVAVLGIEVAFHRTDLSLELVSRYSSVETPSLYKTTAMWGSQAGSLLLWATVLSIASSAVLRSNRNRHREIMPWAIAVLGGVISFFIALMVLGIVAADLETWPFTHNAVVPAEGQGLTPLLRHWAMAIHPPMLYSGYVFFTIPFAFAVGALITRRVDAGWIRSTRRFALIAWSFLSIGLILGAFWSYNELGWGGYWAWDPVENAALMPWLTGTAFLHSIQVQERRGMLRVWNVSLIALTFVLSLLGTFLVRSGVLQSIHAFGDSKVGPFLLGLIAVVIIGSVALIISRLDSLRAPRRIDSVFSREAAFFLNNLVLVTMAVVIFWGTFLPLITDAIGERKTIAAPWYDSFTTPLAIGLVFLAGIGPLAAWRRISLAAVRRLFLIPLLGGIVGVAAVAATAGHAGDHRSALGLFFVAGFAITAVLGEVLRSASARRSLTSESPLGALARTVARNRRRYGGYLVHIGIALMLIGVAASSSFKTSQDATLRVGETTTVGDYELTYAHSFAEVDSDENKLILGAVLVASKDGEEVARLTPSRNYYGGQDDLSAPLEAFYFEGSATSEVGKRTKIDEDLWTAMQPDLNLYDEVIKAADLSLRGQIPKVDPNNVDVAAMRAIPKQQGRAILKFAGYWRDDGGVANFRINVNPFVIWVWLGALVGIGGAAFALWPGAGLGRQRVSEAYAARLARELEQA